MVRSASPRHSYEACEILDTRIVRRDPKTGQPRTVMDTIADNAANAGVVTGSRLHTEFGMDLCRVGAVVSRNGVVEETGLGAGVLGNPVLGVVWLARRLALLGQSIKADDIELSGSFIRPIEAPPGSTIHADFGSFGCVSCHFS